MSKIKTGMQILNKQGLEGIFSTIRGAHLPRARKRFRALFTEHFDWAINLKKAVKIDGCNFSLDSPLIKAQHKLELMLGEYEFPEREALKRFLNPALPVVEMGGAIGIVSCLTNKRLNDPSRHVVIEANPLLLPLLEENRRRNNCQFQIVNAAVGYGSPTVDFTVFPNHYLASSAVKPDHSHLTPERRAIIKADPNTQLFQTVSAKAVSLKSVLDEHDFPRCTLICDIEGTEKDLVDNEVEVLRDRVELIIVEIHNNWLGRKVVQEVIMRIKTFGFDLIHEESQTYTFRRKP